MKVITCSSPYGRGGIGQHFAQLVEEARAGGELARYYAPDPKPGEEKQRGRRISLGRWRWLWRYTPARFSPRWTSYLQGEVFDYVAAAQLTGEAEQLMAFVGEALHSFRKANRLGVERLELVAANSHVNNLKRRHAAAHRQTGIRDTWLHDAQRRKTLKEYDMADVIHIHSEYVRQTFLQEGVPAGKLCRTTLRPAERFVPPNARPDDDVFRVVYVGRVEATKGLPLLMEAFGQLDDPAELTIVGNWPTRVMRKYMQQQLQRDSRIQMAPGDPLPHLQRADVFVHPTFEDGFGYAPMEALACGTPVIATEDTGMKEYVREGENGFVVPTGSSGALLERMRQVRRRPLTRTQADGSERVLAR